MRENGDGQLFEVVGHAIVAAFEEGASLGGALQHQGAARADAERQLVGVAGAIDNFESVVMQAGVYFYVGDGFLHGEDFADVGDRLESFDWIIEGTAAQNLAFSFVRWITHLDAHQKAVKLRFGKRVGAVMLDGILRGDDEKGLWQRMRFAVHGDLRFVHSFEESGLRARSGAIDFVGENDVGEKWAGAELKFARVRLIDTDAENVARQKIGSE